MKASIRSFSSSDTDLNSFAPDDPALFAVSVELMIGAVGDDGDDIFSLAVVTPRWLAEQTHRVGPVLGRHLLIVEAWDWPAIKRFLECAVEAEVAGSWDELAARLGRLALWEFEDYRDLDN